MAKHLGREVIFKRGGEPIANLRTKSLSVNREAVDVTDDDSDGWREILGTPGQIEVDWSVSGVLANDSLRAEALTSGGIDADEVEYPDGGTLSGDFFLASYSETHEYNDAATFEAELQSSGEISYTAPTP